MKKQRFIITESMMDSLYGYNNAQYDQHAKRLLASRKLLAEIVKKVVPEFHDVSTADIAEKYIEGTPQVGNIPVNPGLSNVIPSQIKGDRNEDGAPKEGYITYDILFHARAPGTGEPITLIINVEAQRTQQESKLKYRLMKRLFSTSAVSYLRKRSGNLKERTIIVLRKSIPSGSAWIPPAETAISIITSWKKNTCSTVIKRR